jgi:hypothetical protein
MVYRDDLPDALARIEKLERECDNLRENNADLHRQNFLLRSGPTSLALELSTAGLSQALYATRREVRRTRWFIVLMLGLYWLTMGGWIPL